MVQPTGVRVDRDPRTCFPDLRHLADSRRHVDIDGSHTLRRCVAGPDRLGRGSEFVMSMRLWGVPYRVRNRVVEFEENRLIAWRHFEPQHWRFELQPTKSGTRVTETFDYSYWHRAGAGTARSDRLAMANHLCLGARLRWFRFRRRRAQDARGSGHRSTRIATVGSGDH